MRYFGGFDNVESVRSNFSSYGDDYAKIDDVELQDSEVLFASYGGGGYEGEAIVIFYRDGKMFEAHGSHCSCNGLEGQWSPEEVSIEHLEHRIANGNLEYFRENHGEEAFNVYRTLGFYTIFEREVLNK